MNRLVIFDGNHLLYRSYYKFMNLKTLGGVKTSIIYGFPYIMESLIRKLMPTEVITVFDGRSKSKFRLNIAPDYKKRDKKLGWDSEDFFRQRDVVIEMLKHLGIAVAKREDLEADDVITLVTRTYVKRGYEVIIVSGDKDFNQLISDKVSIFNVGKKKMYTQLNLQQLLGYLPKQTVDYLSLLGDSSDNIPGYHGIGEKKALNLLDMYGSVKAFLNSEDDYGKVDKNKLRELHKKNKRLIDLKLYYRKFLVDQNIPFLEKNPKFDFEKFRIICGEYETNSLLKKQFLKTYKNLYYGI